MSASGSQEVEQTSTGGLVVMVQRAFMRVKQEQKSPRSSSHGSEHASRQEGRTPVGDSLEIQRTAVREVSPESGKCGVCAAGLKDGHGRGALDVSEEFTEKVVQPI